MKGDFTRLTFDAVKHYARVLKQQGRVDLDADWNEATEIALHLDRTLTRDVVGETGVPIEDDGFRVEIAAGGVALTFTPGRIYVNGILAEQGGSEPVPLTDQPDLPGYLADGPQEDGTYEDGTYLVYVDVWDRHVTYIEDPELREVALGGPDTTTRTRTISQVRVHRMEEAAADGPLPALACQPFPAPPNTGLLSAQTDPEEDPGNPCVIPAAGGYRGLENRLYRIEIHDDGRDEQGNVERGATFKWSRDNGSVVLPIAEGGIEGDTVTVRRLGHDDVLTVRPGDLVEVLGDTTELHGRPGTLARVDAVDRAELRVSLTPHAAGHHADDHGDEAHLKLRRWDHDATDDVDLVDGALPVQTDWFELEDGVQVRFEADGEYAVGDFWLIPARTREGSVLWPRTGDPATPVPLPPRGIRHHFATLAVGRVEDGVWTELRDCRPLFPPLTDVGTGECCCIDVSPGDDIQDAIDRVTEAGGGCISLCAGLHVVRGSLRIREARDLTIRGQKGATLLRFDPEGNEREGVRPGGILIESSERITLERFLAFTTTAPALVTVRYADIEVPNREVVLRQLTLLNLAPSDGETYLTCGVRLGEVEGVTLEECRIGAEAGVLGLWGDQLPEIADIEGSDREMHHVTFDDLETGSVFSSGDDFVDPGSGVEVEVRPFRFESGEETGGEALVSSDNRVGGSGNEMTLRSTNLRFALDRPLYRAELRFANQQLLFNVEINGELRVVSSLQSLNGEFVGGVRVAVGSTMTEQGPRGSVVLTGDIQAFAIGGMILHIDDVRLFPRQAEAVTGEFRYGGGVTGLRLDRCRVRFRDFGLLVGRGERCLVSQSDIRSIAAGPLAEARRVAELIPDHGGGVALDASEELTVFRRGLEGLFDAPASEGAGTALFAFLWRESEIRHCTLAGARGTEIWWSIRGSATGNRVRATEAGFSAFWLHETAWRENRVECSQGAAFLFGGCFRAPIADNTVRAPVGLRNQPFAEAIGNLGRVGRTIQRGYGVADGTGAAPGGGTMAHYAAVTLLVQESAVLMGVDGVLRATEEAVSDLLGGIPVALFLAELITQWAENAGGDGALPLIDLQVRHNDFACGPEGVALRGFVPLGKVRVTGNRIHASTGRGVLVESFPFFSNARLVVLLYRTMLRRLDGLIDDFDSGGGMGIDLGPVLEELRVLVDRWQHDSESFLDTDFRVEGNTIRSLRTGIDFNLFEMAVLDNHVTIQEREVLLSNVGSGRVTGRVRFAGTELAGPSAGPPGVSVLLVDTTMGTVTDASGAFVLPAVPAGTYTLRIALMGLQPATREITVPGNGGVDVTVTFPNPQADASGSVGFVVQTTGEVPNPEVLEVIRLLEASPSFEHFGLGMRDGAHADATHYARHLATGPLASAEGRAAAGTLAASVRDLSSDPQLQDAAAALISALNSQGGPEIRAALEHFLRALKRQVDSIGILARGAGCRIVGNQVLVPGDAEPDTEALGGIQLSVSFFDTLVAALMMAELLGPETGEAEGGSGFDTLILGVTETLVSGNEVVGGVGHGISVLGVPGIPELIWNLQLRDNEIRGMGGVGVFVNDQAVVIGLEIVGNRLQACGRPVGFSETKGGIVLRTVGLCTIHANLVEQCGRDLVERSAFGIDVETVLELRVTSNVVRGNGSLLGSVGNGGILLEEIYGSVAIDDNEIAFNRGGGLYWTNSSRAGEDAMLPAFLVQLVNASMGAARTPAALAEADNASVQGNRMQQGADGSVPLVRLLNIDEILFSGNTLRSDSGTTPLAEIQLVARGVIASNLLHTGNAVSIAIKKMSAGAVLGNVGNSPIQIVPALPAIERGLNVPPAQ